MKRIIFLVSISIHIFIQIVNAQQSKDLTNYFENESAPGARAAMGIFAAGYGKALADEVFDFKLNTWQNRLTSIAIAAFGSYAFDKWMFPFIKRNIFALNEQRKNATYFTLYPDLYYNQMKIDIKIIF